jgi:hypothetical protein
MLDVAHGNITEGARPDASAHNVLRVLKRWAALPRTSGGRWVWSPLPSLLSRSHGPCSCRRLTG